MALSSDLSFAQERTYQLAINQLSKKSIISPMATDVSGAKEVKEETSCQFILNVTRTNPESA